MKSFKKIILCIITFALLFICSSSLFVYATTFVSEPNKKITVIFSQGNLPNNSNYLFNDITYNDVEINVSKNLIIPGATFEEVINGKINPIFIEDKQIDCETFYFEIDGVDWAYTFTGWQIVGTTDRLPAKTVFQPGDLVLENVLETYVDNSTSTLKLEAIWGKCYFVRNPYPIISYTKFPDIRYAYDAELSKEKTLENLNALYNNAATEEEKNKIKYQIDNFDSIYPLSSDDNDGRTPETSKSTVDGVFDEFRNEVYVTKKQDKFDAYSTVLMLSGELDYVKDTSGSVYNSNGTLTGVSNVFGQLITDSKKRYISLTFKSLQNEISAYNINYKPKSYSNQFYGNYRFDNINLIALPSGIILKDDGTNQTNGGESQFLSDYSATKIDYFETTARYNASIPSGRSRAISTLRPSYFDLVVLNGGSYNSVETTWQTAINSPDKTIEWYVGRNARVNSYVHLGTTATYIDSTQTINVNFKLYVTGGEINEIYGGNRGINSISKGLREIYIFGDGSSKGGQFNPIINNVYGGSDQSVFYGDIYLNILNCTKITNVYGGGKDYTATTYGNIYISIENSKLLGDLYGGGKNANSEKTDEISGGNVSININNSSVVGNIYGSGMGMTQELTLTINSNSYGPATNWFNLNLYPEGWEYPLGYDENGNLDKNNEFYYPKYEEDTGYVVVSGYKSLGWTDVSATTITFKKTVNKAYLSLATVENVVMNIHNCVIGTSTNGKGNVYGGGSIAKILGNTEINITGDNTIIYGSVYGGGDGVSVPTGVKVYKTLDSATYDAPRYTITTISANNVPTVKVTSQSPHFNTSSYGDFTWSNDISLLDSDTPGIDLDKKLLYSPNTVGLGKVFGNCAVNINGGIIKGSVYGGGNKGAVDGNTTVTISGNVTIPNVFGGCNQSDVAGSTTLIINDGTIGNAYGGNNQSGIISNDINININGGYITSLYGGGNMADAPCDTTIKIDNSTLEYVYGGGKEAEVNNITFSNVTNSTITYLYGGGDKGITLGDINVNISCEIETLFGGANQADINGKIVLNVNNSNIDTIYGGNNQSGLIGLFIDMNINNSTINTLYGGGNKANATIDSNINVNSSIIDHLYGGGKQATTKSSYIEILNSTLDYIYGGGYAGDILENTQILIDNDSTINVNLYGGGENGNVLGSTNILINDITLYGNLYGGGYAGNVLGDSTITFNNGIVHNNIYGGGFAGTINNTSLLITDKNPMTFANNDSKIIIYGNVFGGGEGETATVNLSTNVIIDLNLDMTVTEQHIVGDEISGKSEIEYSFNNEYSTIMGSVYGGGDLGQVGIGTISTTNNTAQISSYGKTNVQILDGYIGQNVFGGGSGIPRARAMYNIYMGTIFGETLTTVNGGFIGGNIYGGGTQSRLYKSNETVNVATVNIIESDKKILIVGSVFGGGDRGNSATTNASIATTIGNVVINIEGSSNGSSQIYFASGGVYGDGNLCLVNGNRVVNMTNFTTGTQYLKTFYSLQRADIVNITNSDIVLLGAIDLVEEGDTSIYSINRIEQLNLNNGSTIKLDQIVKYLENITSDQYTDRKFIINGNNGSNSTEVPDDLEPLTKYEIENYIKSTEDKNVVCVANGLYLELMKDDSTNSYGTYKGLVILQLLRANPGEGGGFVYADIGTSTGDFICATKFDEDGEYMYVVDDRGGYIDSTYSYYCWYIQGKLINYTVLLEGYIGSEQTSYADSVFIPNHDVKIYYILNSLSIATGSTLDNAISSGKYKLVSKSTGLANQEIAIELQLGDNSWFLEYDSINKVWSFAGKTGAYGISENLRENILASNVLIDDEHSQAKIILHKSTDVNAEITNMELEIELLKYVDDPNKNDNIVEYDGTNRLNFRILFSIVRLVPVQNSYYGPYKNYVGLNESKKISITSGSSFTFEYQTRYIPNAFPMKTGQMTWGLSTRNYAYYLDELGNYMTLDVNGNVISISSTLTLDPNETTKILVTKSASGYYQYEHDGRTITMNQKTVAQNSYIPVGTKITMIDLTLTDVPGYYYYICKSNIDYIDLTEFMQMGTTIKIKDGNKPSFISQYEMPQLDNNGQSYRITERLIFVFDFEEVEFSVNANFTSTVYLNHNYGSGGVYSDIMDYVKAETTIDSTIYSRSYPKIIEYTVNSDVKEDGIDQFEIQFENNQYYENETAVIKVNVNDSDEWTNTKVLEGKFGIKIISAIPGGKLPDGIKFTYENIEYYPMGMNEYVIIPISKFGEHSIMVNNILGTIKTSTKAEFIASMVILPDIQYSNNCLSNINTIIDADIQCSVLEVEKGYLKTVLEKSVIEEGENLNITIYSKGDNDLINAVLFNTIQNDTHEVKHNLSYLIGTPNGNKQTILIERLFLSPGVYNIIFTNGNNEEVVTFVIK